MPATISRLLMCFGVLMGAVVVYLLVYLYIEDRYDEVVALIWAGVISCSAFSLGWTLTWCGMVHWSGRRTALTQALILGCIFPAGLVFMLIQLIDPWASEELGIFVGTLVWATSWLIGTAFIWRENAKERGERLRQLGIHAVACPDCGYNLTGLREAKCPECGAAYTLDQLYATITEQRAELGGE